MSETPRLRAWHIYSPLEAAKEECRQVVPNVEAAAYWLSGAAAVQVGDESICWNAQGLEVEVSPDKWEEWDSDDYDSIEAYMKENGL